MEYKPIIGLEIHAQLQTRSKAFCACPAYAFDALPNSCICEICTGQPGTLPKLNESVLALAIRTAIAFNCRINERSSFDRKNYFYPDLPKGYQITQYFNPFAENGYVMIIDEGRKKKIRIRRIHIEEDAGKTLYHRSGREDRSYIDFNRSGVPLIEIVTEPDIDSSYEAHLLMEEIRNTLKTIGVCSGDMEKGALRCDVNISVKNVLTLVSSARIEIKNINSFKYVQKAVEYEYARLTELLKNGERTVSETRSWDYANRSTSLMRVKEEESDYRYFPDPDLPDIIVTANDIQSVKDEMPELPFAKHERYVNDYGLTDSEVKTYIEEPELDRFFCEAIKKGLTPRSVTNWLLGDIQKYLKENGITLDQTSISIATFKELLEGISVGRISNHIAKALIPDILKKAIPISFLLEEKGIYQINDRTVIYKISEKILANNPEKVEAYRFGKTGLLKYFIGLVMKETRGQSEPSQVQKILLELLAGDHSERE
jgi:aspartyl-tRNA(Asn)/glutamyl-tRNA(Gln) amidotransferase subunit B